MTTTIAVDIDGVIATLLENGEYPKDYEKKKPIELSLVSLKKIKDLNFKVFLYTSRPYKYRDETLNWLSIHGFTDLFDELIMDKPKYDLLIDDRAFRFENWEKTTEFIIKKSSEETRWY